MDRVERDQEISHEELREQREQIKEEFQELKNGQHSLETTVRGLGSKLDSHVDRSKQRRSDRWKWLQYLVFPLLLGVTVKVMDWVFG